MIATAQFFATPNVSESLRGRNLVPVHKVKLVTAFGQFLRRILARALRLVGLFSVSIGWAQGLGRSLSSKKRVIRKG